MTHRPITLFSLSVTVKGRRFSAGLEHCEDCGVEITRGDLLQIANVVGGNCGENNFTYCCAPCLFGDGGADGVKVERIEDVVSDALGFGS